MKWKDGDLKSHASLVHACALFTVAYFLLIELGNAKIREYSFTI